MTTKNEYWLQKKTIGGWSHVTWYATYDEAWVNYSKLEKNAGYSYRLVEVKVMHEDLLEEVVKVEAPVIVVDKERYKAYPGQTAAAKANVWGGQKPNNKEWVDPPALKQAINNGWGDLPSDGEKLEHGLSGSVWLIHHANKHKGRFAANVVDEMISKGYEKGGPRTQFRE